LNVGGVHGLECWCDLVFGCFLDRAHWMQIPSL
jgi:hypothetical protein